MLNKVKPPSAARKTPMLKVYTHCFALILTFACLMPASFAHAEPEQRWWKLWQKFGQDVTDDSGITRIDEAHKVQDLAYGELLFDYYQQHYMTSITKILVEQDRGQFKHHKQHADLLLGTLYLSYGLVNQAESIFKLLIEKSVNQETQNIAWLKLAEIYIDQGDLIHAQDILNQKLIRPIETVDNQKHEHLGNIALTQGQYSSAIKHFDALKNAPLKQRYAGYNTAIAYLQQNQAQLALEKLQSLIAQPVSTREEDALRDKAAIALGHYYLLHEEPFLASNAFKTVRLHGPFADQALLGLGWANLTRTQTKQALAPWVALSKRDPSSPSTQKALLMVPRTFENLDAWRNAYEGYQLARITYQDEINRIEQAIIHIKENDWLNQLQPREDFVQQHDKPLDYQNADIPTDGQDAGLLFRLFASDEFDQGFQQYWFLESLNIHLSQWQKQMPVYRGMLANHQTRHAEMIPEVNQQLNKIALKDKKAQLANFEQRFHRIIDNNDLESLANGAETLFFGHIESAENILSKYPDNDSLSSHRDKQRLAKGVLLWDINEQASDRKWKLQKQLKQTTVALFKLEQKQAHLQNAERYADDRFTGYEQRIDELESRNQALSKTIRQVQKQQQKQLQLLAEALLKKRLTHVGNLLANAQLAIARLQDKASVEGNSKQ
ncbi:MAG: hypothetical protein COB04_00220 [Gammaproteobacteria bacterium]|nr:MAG: hypothetical protein COB04_00220 [Gammaproteobacteria bacterium]